MEMDKNKQFEIEFWMPVIDYEGLYEVSDHGRVRRFKHGKINLLNGCKNNDGYLRVSLSKDGKQKKLFVHRIVWEAFNAKIPDGYETDHVNGDKIDNSLKNLKIVTHSENIHNPVTYKRYRDVIQSQKWKKNMTDAVRKSHNKPIAQIDKTTGETIRIWESARDAWRKTGILYENISACCYGRQKSAGGYKWCFAS